MKKLLKEKKAITLIALVITIVVLVILAAVVISMTVGNDGLISKASASAERLKGEEYREHLVTKIGDFFTEQNHEHTLQEFVFYLQRDKTEDYTISLQKSANVSGAIYIGESKEIYVQYRKYEYRIDDKFNVFLSKYIGDLQFEASLSSIDWVKNIADETTIKGTISSKNGEIVKIIVTKPDNTTEDVTNRLTESGEFSYNVGENGVYTIRFTDITSMSFTQQVIVNKKVDADAPKNVVGSATISGDEVTISATAEDDTSKINYFTYTIKKGTSLVTTGTFTGNNTTTKLTDFGVYQVSITAYDDAGNNTTVNANNIIYEHAFKSGDRPIFGLPNSVGGNFQAWYETKTSSSVSVNSTTGIATATKSSSNTGGQVGGMLTTNKIDCTGYTKLCIIFGSFTSSGNGVGYQKCTSTGSGNRGSYGFEPDYNGGSSITVSDSYWCGSDYVVICSIPTSGSYRFGIYQWAGSYNVTIKKMWLTK